MTRRIAIIVWAVLGLALFAIPILTAAQL